MSHQIHIGSNLDVLPTMPDNSVDAIVTDHPYELRFMGKVSRVCVECGNDYANEFLDLCADCAEEQLGRLHANLIPTK